jgi:hypothetical protein
MSKQNKIVFLFLGSLLVSLIVQGQGMKISSGGYVIVHSGYFRISENLINNGTYRDQDGTLIFSGSTQTLAGTQATTLNNLTVFSGSTTTIGTAGQTMKGVLTSDGTLQADGNLNLLSTSGQTALVSGSGTGSVTGNITMQRYLDSGFGYKYFSSPFQSATVSEFGDEVDLAAAFPAFYRYYENSDTTWWIDYTTGGNVLLPMAGYAANFGSDPAPKTVDITGVVSNGSMFVNLYNHNKLLTKGFNLVGNPYPSPIDWDAPGGWTRNNIDNAVYYFNPGSTDQYIGSYSTYINGVSSDGIANNIIPAMQGFFVHVSNGSFPVAGVLGFSNDIRVNTPDPDFHKSGPKEEDILIRISAGLLDTGELKDPLVVMFDPDASASFNERRDAVKLMNTKSDVPSFFSIAEDNRRYAIKALPTPTDSMTVIPLGISIKQSGIVKFSVMTLEQNTQLQNIYFSDKKKRTVVSLGPDFSYQVLLDEGECDNRFSLVLSKKELQTNSGTGTDLDAFYHNGNIYVYLDFLNGETGELQISDMLGRIIFRDRVGGLGYRSVAVNAQSGVYIVTLRTEQEVASKKVLIHQ